MIIDEVIKIRFDHRAMGARKLFEKIQPFLLEHQIKIGRDALFDVLGAHGLLVRKRQRRISTTISYHRFHKWPNLIIAFVPSAPNQLYVSDITYWKIASGFVYISLITDAYSHKIVGYQVADNMRASESVVALQMALSSLDIEAEIIHHSDRGIQYCSDEYVKLLQDNNIKISMTENSDPRENAIAERVNGILKQEYLDFYRVGNIEEAKQQLAIAIHLYNTERPHMSIGNLIPNQFHQTKTKAEKLWKNYYPKKLNVNPI
jgi:putative transposase